ncbi:MFS transporter [Streptomyces sp. NPDC007904]|jgi:predicted MFS family arabinose efflux permease|uniref:MFS transporter n=1 Tax=Streptomyces sp. NPDC007904 TaxID=3364787 RepID=UPI0036E225C2
MRSYRDLFRTPEFTPLFLVSSAQTMGQTMSGLAVAMLVYRQTASPLLSALSMFGPSLAHVLGATLLMSAADRLPPRATTTATALAFAAATAVLALPGLPLAAVFAVLLAKGLVASVGGGVRWGLLNEVLPKEGYLLGRSVFTMMNGLTQVVGYATGGVLVALLSPRLSLLLATALYATGAATARLGLSLRAPRAAGRPSVRATWRANALLWSSRPRRHVYLALWIPNGLIVGCESLYVSYAPDSAGTLFACAALGMLAGDVAVGRLIPPARRPRLGFPLLLLLAVPYLFLVLHPPVPVAAALVTVASAGFGASLVQQERLMDLTPPDLSGHALGLHSSGMLTLQGLSAALAGALAQSTSPAAAMTMLAAASTGVTLTLLLTAPRRRTAVPA